MTLTLSPVAASEGGRLPATSARPPVLQKGTASLVTYKMFMPWFSFLPFDQTTLFLLTTSG